jgi:ABC-type amino acid transport substrate-binding protein
MLRFMQIWYVVLRHALCLHATVALIVAPLLTGTTLASPTIENIKRTGTIRIAHRESSVPFSFIGPDNAAVGYSMDLCGKVVNQIRTSLGIKNLEVKYVPVKAPERIPALVEGKADLECGNTTNTPERRKSVSFSVPMFVAGIRVMSDKQLPVERLGDLAGKRVVVAPGTTAAKLVETQNKNYATNMKVVEVKDNADAMKALEGGQADAWVTDDIILHSFRASSKSAERWVVSRRSLTVEPLAIMMRKDDPAFADVVNKEIRRVMLSGEIQGIYKKWFESPVPGPGFNLNLPMGPLLRAFVENPSTELPVNF